MKKKTMNVPGLWTLEPIRGDNEVVIFPMTTSTYHITRYRWRPTTTTRPNNHKEDEEKQKTKNQRHKTKPSHKINVYVKYFVIGMELWNSLMTGLWFWFQFITCFCDVNVLYTNWKLPNGLYYKTEKKRKKRHCNGSDIKPAQKGGFFSLSFLNIWYAQKREHDVY